MEIPNKDELIREIEEFYKNPNNWPSKQPKMFFTDAKSYYKQLCQITRVLANYSSSFDEIRLAIAQIMETMATKEEVEGKLTEVVLEGTGFDVISSVTEDGIQTITIAVSSEAGGTVTSITAGNGLTGGTITDSGTIAIDEDVVALKSDLTGLETTSHAAATYQAKADMDDYLVKEDAPGYDDILTETSAAATYETQTHAQNTYATQTNLSSLAGQGRTTETVKGNADDIETLESHLDALEENGVLPGIADETTAPDILAYPSNGSAILEFGQTSDTDPTIKINFDTYDEDGKTSGLNTQLAFDRNDFEVQNNHMQIKESKFATVSLLNSKTRIFDNVAKTIATSGWVTTPNDDVFYGVPECAYKYDITISDITSNSSADVIPHPSSDVSKLAMVTNCLSGKVRLYSSEIPTENITIIQISYIIGA